MIANFLSLQFNYLFVLGLVEYALIGIIVVHIGLLIMRMDTILDYLKNKNTENDSVALFVLFRKTGVFIVAYGILKVINAVLGLLEFNHI
jgi:uncharacterized protein with PQ loop repeat